MEPTGGKIILLNGAFDITTAMTYTSDFSVTIEGETRGREEFASRGNKAAYGVFLMVDTLGAEVIALTISTSLAGNNLGMCRLSNFTMRGVPLGTSPNTPGLMRGITLNSPAQTEIDNVAFEYMTDPFQSLNGDDGPLIITWIGFFLCNNSSNSAMMEVVTGTCWIGHIESYNSGNAALAFGGSDNTDIVIDSLWTTVGAALVAGFTGYNPATFTTIRVGALTVGNPWGGIVLLQNSTAGSVHLSIGSLALAPASPNAGYIIQGTGNSTSGTITVVADHFIGNYTKVVNNSSGATVGAGSFVLINNATLTGTGQPAADTKFANMTAFVQEVGSSGTQAKLTGTTAGSAVSGFAAYTVNNKRFTVQLNGYENTTAAAQTITFPYPFTNAPAVIHDDSGGATATATALTLPCSMSGTKSGMIVLEGA
jgi:hypothetical protein